MSIPAEVKIKNFNQDKINWRVIRFMEPLVRAVRLPARLIKKAILNNFNRPYIVVVDAYRIGDSVILRPLIKAIVRKYGVSHRILLVSGAYARLINSDLAHSVEIMEYQFPWSLYDYSFRSIAKTARVFLSLYLKPVAMMIETRGDFRSIVLSYLACPEKLLGFDFTGGRQLLNEVIYDDGKIKHLFNHIEAIAAAIGVELSCSDLRLQKSKQPARRLKKIGISFSGSLPLKILKKEIGYEIIRSFIQQEDCQVYYILGDNNTVYNKNELKAVFQEKIIFFHGCFNDYFNFLRELDLYVGMDSGGGHLCSLWGVPSVIIFGTQHSWYCKPMGRHPVLCLESNKNLACRPCAGRICKNPLKLECQNGIEIKAILEFFRKISIQTSE